ncbi:zinc finger protein 644a [Neosynchiropus ocellatus]
MATEMACLAGLDVEDQDGHPEINVLTLLQDPVRMAQDPVSCNNSYEKSALKHNSSLDVLSNSAILSPIGLENGPSSQPATEAHELESISNEREEEKDMTQLKTVQDIDTAGIWGFQTESPENSLDNGDLKWDPHKEFMHFLWDNQSNSPSEESKDAQLTDQLRRRKRKMDMVVMVDPSEDFYSKELSEGPFEPENHQDSIIITKEKKSAPLPTEKLKKHPNGTIKVKNSAKISTPAFVCKECGQSFRKSGSLIEHMSTHKEKSRRPDDRKARTDKKRDKNKSAKLCCPQCAFVTFCPNTFVEHAKTHKKDKKKLRCDKCSFNTWTESDLKRHKIMNHTDVTLRKKTVKEEPTSFSCNICSYKTFSKTIFENHILIRHDLSYDEYEVDHAEVEAPLSKKQNSSPVQDAEFTSKLIYKHMTTEKACSPKESNEISDLFKNSNSKRVKSQLMHSKLDRSIDILLSKQRDGKKSVEAIKERNNDRISGLDYTKKETEHLSKTTATEAEDSKSERKNHGIFPSSNNSAPKLNHELSVFRKSPSKRKMSKPYRNTANQEARFVLPKPSTKTLNHVDAENDHVFHFDDDESSGNIFENGIKKSKQNIIYTFSRRMSMRGALQASKQLFEKIKTEKQQQDGVDIKEECIESEVFPDTFEPHTIPLGESFDDDDMSDAEVDRKNCPYCPAVFESGVGLSNHIRGHLHRVGINYNARHEVSPEQVAYQDRRPRVRRRISKAKQLKRVAQMESGVDPLQSIHSCPLCGDSFDNRTGQANHIRGHLKKLGRRFITKSKSPVVLLQELMQDKKEFQRAIQLLGRKRNHYRYDDYFTPTVASVSADATPATPTFTLPDLDPEKKEVPPKEGKDSLSGTNALIGILKKRKCLEESKPKASPQMSKNLQPVLSNTEHCPGSKVASSMPNSVCEKGEFNRKVCVHCNATFHSGVSLSNHLRAYAKRKRNALQEGTTFDCKIRKQRSRPGSKKKTPALPQTPEEMYRLTCRFCDLVFQGPLSVQEDWIKHLQRHIMNTSVPHTGLGMVDVAPLDPPSQKTEQDSSWTASDAAL